MKKARRLFCLLAAFGLLISGMVSAETKLYDPVAIVSYDQSALSDWTPGYGLSTPGVLLELTHAEGMLAVTMLEKDGRSPESYLSDRLDRAAETLAVSDAQTAEWSDPFEGDGRGLSFSYTYPEGDETPLCRIWAASYEGMLIELTVDVWGTEAESLAGAAAAAFIEGGFTVIWCEDAIELTATLNDVIEGEDSRAYIQLTLPAESLSRSGEFYPLSTDAVVLFPNPDDPSLLYPVAPDMASLVDAILTYEDCSDGPAAFRAIIENDTIIYMEYSLTM